MSFTLPDLDYSYDALAPFMSAETLEFHHDKHHKAYVDNGNKLLAGSGLENETLEDIIKKSYGKPELTGLFNNAAQHYNHIHFWKWMKKDSVMPDILANALKKQFGSVDNFLSEFVQAGVTQFGSGWAWLAVKDGELRIMKTPNGENPLIHNAIPILGCDVWEHSYYIDYRNARPVYLQKFTENLINWEYVAQLYEAI